MHLTDLLWIASPGKDRVKTVCQDDVYPVHSFSQCCAVAGCYLCNSQFPTGKKKIENNDHFSK